MEGPLTRKDFGVIFDSRLSFTPHIEIIISKYQQTMGSIIRNGRQFRLNTLLRFCNTYGRSHLEYAF